MWTSCSNSTATESTVSYLEFVISPRFECPSVEASRRSEALLGFLCFPHLLRLCPGCAPPPTLLSNTPGGRELTYTSDSNNCGSAFLNLPSEWCALSTGFFSGKLHHRHFWGDGQTASPSPWFWKCDLESLPECTDIYPILLHLITENRWNKPYITTGKQSIQRERKKNKLPSQKSCMLISSFGKKTSQQHSWQNHIV